MFLMELLTLLLLLKIYHPRQGLNLQTLGPMASTLNTRPPWATSVHINEMWCTEQNINLITTEESLHPCSHCLNASGSSEKCSN
jgi:hypothetical protein